MWLGLASVSSICYVPVFSVQRNVLPTGAQTVGGGRVFRDGFLVRYYFASVHCKSRCPWLCLMLAAIFLPHCIVS